MERLIDVEQRDNRSMTMILKVSRDERRRVEAAATALHVSMAAVLRSGIATAEAQVAREREGQTQ